MFTANSTIFINYNLPFYRWIFKNATELSIEIITFLYDIKITVIVSPTMQKLWVKHRNHNSGRTKFNLKIFFLWEIKNILLYSGRGETESESFIFKSHLVRGNWNYKISFWKTKSGSYRLVVYIIYTCFL